MQKIIYTKQEVKKIVQQLLNHISSKKLCFYGAMGAGKTTLIKAIVQELGGADIASSPTFSIVNEYHQKNGELLGFHFDFYRLEDEVEALDMGFEEYLDQDVWVFIEWPERIVRLLPEDSMEIYLEVVDTKTRELRVRS